MKKGVLSLLLLLLFSSLTHAVNHSADVIIRAIEESGEVVTNAEVMVFFEQDSRGGKGVKHEGETNTNGVYSVTETTSGYITVRVSKEGYYESREKLKWHHQQRPDGSYPSSGTINDVVLRRKINPIPMYTCSLRKELPIADDFVGLDLKKRDWVQPYGSGLFPDIEFKISRNYTDIQNFMITLDVRFPDKFDGIQIMGNESFQASSLKWPRFAPGEGYINGVDFEMKRENGQLSEGYYKNQSNYFIRVRSKIDENGEVISSLYGKIVGGINFGGLKSEKASVWFTYYLNPTPNDRNVEFDPDQNLFTDLTSQEQVRDP